MFTKNERSQKVQDQELLVDIANTEKEVKAYQQLVQAFDKLLDGTHNGGPVYKQIADACHTLAWLPENEGPTRRILLSKKEYYLARAKAFYGRRIFIEDDNIRIEFANARAEYEEAAKGCGEFLQTLQQLKKERKL